MQLIWFETGRSRRCRTPSKLAVRELSFRSGQLLTWTLSPLDATPTKTGGRGLTVTRPNSDRRALRQSPRCGEPAHQFLFFLQQAAHFRGCGISLDAPLHIRELPLGLAVLQGFDAT